MTAETVFCRLCERFHEPEDVCENDRDALYGDLLSKVSQLAAPVGELPGHQDRVLLFAVAQQRLAQLLHLDAIDQAAIELGTGSPTD